MPKKPDIWMPWYLGDYLRDTTHLSRAEHGSYLLLLAHAWMHKGILPVDDVRLATIARATTEEWAACRETIMGFWTRTDAGYIQKRQLEELEKAQHNVEQKSLAGKASAAKRWGNGKHNGEGNGKVTGVIFPLSDYNESNGGCNGGITAGVTAKCTITSTSKSKARHESKS